MNSIAQIIVNISIQASLVLIVAIFYQMLFNITKFSNFAHAAIITIAPYLVYLLNGIFSELIFVNLVLAILFSVFIGVLIEIVIYRRMRKSNAPKFTYLIASIGVYLILQNILSITFGDETKAINMEDVVVGHEILGAYITTIQLIIILVSTLLFIGTWWFQKYTIVGKSMRAVASNAELCNIYGINSNKVILWSFAIGSTLGSIAGILSAYDTNMTPTFGFNLLLYGVVAMIIGGMGSMRGLIGGAFLVVTAQHLSAYYLDTKWMDAVAYIILIIFLIWMPYGFSGNRLKKVEI